MGKTALKLLLVFVEYTESNSRVLYEGIQAVDSNQGKDLCKTFKRYWYNGVLEKKTPTVPKGFKFVRIVGTEFLQAIRQIMVHA